MKPHATDPSKVMRIVAVMWFGSFSVETDEQSTCFASQP